MFREPKHTASKIIELIQALPESEQKKVANKLSAQVKTKPRKQSSKSNSSYLKKIEVFQKYVEQHRFKAPKGFKFDREEANAR